MQDHYNINAEQMRVLKKRGITPALLYKNLKRFSTADGFKSDEEISVINLMHFVDKQGDFRKKPNSVLRRIARAVYKSMTTKQKYEIMKYIDGHEEDENE